MPTASQIRSVLKSKGNPENATLKSQFYKAGPGGYAEGDKFFSISVPEQRKTAHEFADLPLDQLVRLLRDPYHECRLTALFIMIAQFRRADPNQRSVLVDTYLANLDSVNNWDLVDSSAHQILGTYLSDKDDRSILYTLAKTDHLWSQRIAIVATHNFIRQNDFADALAISEILLHHPHDLIHKAVGWTVREIGKRDEKILTRFLAPIYQSMPRTALRYAIEKFDRETRTAYLKGEV